MAICASPSIERTVTPVKRERTAPVGWQELAKGTDQSEIVIHLVSNIVAVDNPELGECSTKSVRCAASASASDRPKGLRHRTGPLQCLETGAYPLTRTRRHTDNEIAGCPVRSGALLHCNFKVSNDFGWLITHRFRT
jgi:hypothetical protein